MNDRHAGDLVSAHLDGELDAETAAWVEDHLAGCPSCRRAADDAAAARAWVRDSPTVDGAPAVAGFLSRHRAVIRTGTAFVGSAAVALGALAMTTAVLHPEVLPPVDALVDAHRDAWGSGTEAPPDMADPRDEDAEGVTRVAAAGSVYAAPPAMSGSRVRLSRHAVYDGRDLTIVLYRDGTSGVSVFQQPGTLEWDELPDGAIETVGPRTVWVRHGTPTVMVTEVGDLVVTVVSDDRRAVTTVVEGLPEVERGSTWDRLHDACVRLTRAFAAG